MGNFTSNTQIVPPPLPPPAPQTQSKYWCFQCQSEIETLTSEMKCPQCSSDAIEQITATNDPRSHDVFTTHSENNQPQPQQPMVLNLNPHPNIPIFPMNNGGTLQFTLNRVPINWENLNNNLQNLFRMMAQNGEQQSKATAQQLSLLEIGEVEQCNICQEEGGQGLKLGCGHIFHNHCILPWLDRKNNCPTCRVVLKRE